jgi:hypothetical protein
MMKDSNGKRVLIRSIYGNPGLGNAMAEEINGGDE